MLQQVNSRVKRDGSGDARRARQSVLAEVIKMMNDMGDSRLTTVTVQIAFGSVVNGRGRVRKPRAGVITSCRGYAGMRG
jgi:hypothetical protein